MRVGQNTTFYIVSVFVLTYATTTLDLPRPTILTATLVGALVAGLLCPLYGHLGDRFGFGRVMLVALVLQAVFAFPFFLLVDTRNFGAILLAVVVAIAGGAAAADAFAVVDPGPADAIAARLLPLDPGARPWAV